MDYKKLQNGTDIRGVGSEGIEGQPVNLTDEVAYRIGASFIIWLSNKKGKEKGLLRVGIGRDSRLSGPRLLAKLIEGMTDQGATVNDAGYASTPAMFMSTVADGFCYDGAVMITASHLPFNRNGMKFFTSEGGLEKKDIGEILACAERGDFPHEEKGLVRQVDFMDTYAGILLGKIRKAAGEQRPLEGSRILVDAGNGVGGFFVEKVLKPLGADTTGSQFLEPDGSFPNHIPNPEDKDAIASVVKAVKENHAELGIVFDTDVDRAGAVDGSGRAINKNRLIALISAILLEETPGTTIVTDSVTSVGLAKFIAAKGGVHHRFKRGYKNVINESKRLNASGVDSQLAMETSGHGALKENYFLDDGAYLMVKILIKMAQLKKEGKTLFDVIADLEEPAESLEYRIKILLEDCKPYAEDVIAKVQAFVEASDKLELAPDNYEGIRAAYGKNKASWFLLRMSLHDPIMPLNIEGETAEEAEELKEMLIQLLKPFDKLDTSVLK